MCIKAICACGMVELDRDLQGYRLTPLGQELCDALRVPYYTEEKNPKCGGKWLFSARAY